MHKKLKNIVSLVVLVLFLLPPLVQDAHSHEVFVCKAKHEKHFHNDHEKCIICNFEFSTYSFNTEHYKLNTESLPDTYNSLYLSVNHAIQPGYSFLLRGPPLMV